MDIKRMNRKMADIGRADSQKDRCTNEIQCTYRPAQACILIDRARYTQINRRTYANTENNRITSDIGANHWLPL